MSVTYLLPSNRPVLLATQVAALEKFKRPADEIVVSTIAGMGNAIRHAMGQVHATIVRNCADDDDYCLPDSTKAVEIMEADPSIDVLVTGGYKSHRQWKNKAVCIPRGVNYGSTLECVAWYGACGSGLFMRTEAVRKYSLLDYDGRFIDNFAVLTAIAAGLKVKFCRLDTYRHYMSLSDMPQEQYAAYQQDKKSLRSRFGIWGVERRMHEAPPAWDGAFA